MQLQLPAHLKHSAKRSPVDLGDVCVAQRLRLLSAPDLLPIALPTDRLKYQVACPPRLAVYVGNDALRQKSVDYRVVALVQFVGKRGATVGHFVAWLRTHDEGWIIVDDGLARAHRGGGSGQECTHGSGAVSHRCGAESTRRYHTAMCAGSDGGAVLSLDPPRQACPASPGSSPGPRPAVRETCRAARRTSLEPLGSLRTPL